MRDMSLIPDFTETELWLIRNALHERYGHKIEPELGDSEIRLSSADRELSEVPIVFWSEQKANFVIIKTGDRHYRSQFYYRVHEQFGTGIQEYDDLTECVVATLQVQTDQQRSTREKADRDGSV